MTLTLSQKMLKKLRVSMNMDALTKQERMTCEARLKLTEKIDHILYTEWDPIGVSSLIGFDCADEYQGYLPSVVEMVWEGRSIAEVSDLLLDWEDWLIKEFKVRRRSDVVAVMVSRYGPNAANHPFVPVIDTATLQAVHQSVLDLITQTRVDAYEHRWRAVLAGYEKAVALCQAHLPGHHELKGACLNNLGMACSQTGNLARAQEMYALALPALEPGAQTDYRHLMVCLNNLINCLEHRRQFAATRPYYEWMLRMNVLGDGWDDERTRETQKRLEASGNTRRPAPRLRPRRVPVEQDAPSIIGQVIYVD